MPSIYFSVAVANLNISKYESKSQRPEQMPFQDVSCCQSQYFKVRKQITTNPDKPNSPLGLLPISIFQSTKANHNECYSVPPQARAVANLNISKYESKSQPFGDGWHTLTGCCQSQYFKVRKQITTITAESTPDYELLPISIF